MIMKRLAMVILVQIVVGVPFGSGAFAQGLLSAPSASEIDGKVTASLNELYSQNEAARALGRESKGGTRLSRHTKRSLYSRRPIWLRRSS